jgi:hypothetical protein
MTSPAPSQIATVLDKHLTTVVNCLQNVVYVGLLVYFLEVGMYWICFAANQVSPAASWKGFAYNLWFGTLVIGMMRAFKDTLEALILFENLKRNQDGKKEAITVIAVDKAGAQIKHVDNGSTNTTWATTACFILNGFLNKAATNEAELAQNEKEAATPSGATEDETAKNEEDAKEATTTSGNNEDEIKQDAASASSSTRSNADTSEVFNQ